MAFTGSTEIGKMFLRYSGESNMKQVSLECGGKIAQHRLGRRGGSGCCGTAAAWGIFFNPGEVCTAASRLIVEDDQGPSLDKIMDASKN